MDNDVVRTPKNNIKETREYLFEKYCQSWGAEKRLPPWDMLLHYIRDPILPHKARMAPGVWLFSSIQLRTRPTDVLAGTPGMTIMRDFVEAITEHTRGASIPDTIMSAIFDMLVATKLRTDYAEINENRKRMEENSEENLKEVLKEIMEESKEDQIVASMTNNFAKIKESVIKASPPPPPPLEKAEKASEQPVQSPASESPIRDVTLPQPLEKAAKASTKNKPTIRDVTFSENGYVDDSDDDDLPKPDISRTGLSCPDDDEDKAQVSINGSINGAALDELIIKAENAKRDVDQEKAKKKHEEEHKAMMALAAGDQGILLLKLNRFEVYAATLELEKWKLYKLYGCFVGDISSRILAETTFEQTNPSEKLETLNCEPRMYRLISEMFERLKPQREIGVTELFEYMSIKSFTFKAFYIYLYQISKVYASIYDNIIRRPISTTMDKIALATSQSRSMIDQLAEMSLILKYFWGQFVFRQLTRFDDTPALQCARTDPVILREITTPEIRMIFAPDKEKMEEDKKRQRRKGLKYELRYIFKTETITCTPYHVLVRFCRCREQFHLLFQTFVLKALPDKEMIVSSLMYKSRNNPLRHIVLNILKDNDFYEHEMWPVVGEFDSSLAFKLECIQNKTVQLLKFGEADKAANRDLFLEMLTSFDNEITNYIDGKRQYISTLASLYLIFLVETYFTRHEGIHHVYDNRFDETWASKYFLPRTHPDLLMNRIHEDDEPFIAKVTGGMFMLRIPDNTFVVADVLTILHKYKEEVMKLGGILFFEERYPIDDFLTFKCISMHKLK